MVAQHYRWDFVGLSTDVKPTPETSEKVVDGSTFYCSDTSKLYVYCTDNWYERKPLGGGGGGGGSYTAGEGINITDDTISVDTTTIQKKLTAGTNVNISDQNVISATDTTYNNFVGTDGWAAGTAGLVPAPATTDAGKFLKADGTWDTAGGGGPTVVQTTGTSTTDVMSQNAVTSMVFADPSTNTKIKIGEGTNAGGSNSITIGAYAKTLNQSVALGYGAEATGLNGVALGYGAKAGAVNSIGFAFSNATTQGQMNLQLTGAQSSNGYNNSAYRLIRGVYDGQQAHDAATVGQITPLSDSTAPTTATVGRLGQIFIDTTNADAYMCVAVDDVTPSYTWKKISP